MRASPSRSLVGTTNEIAACLPWLEAELDVVKPDALVCLGATAAQALLETDETIGRLRKRWVTWRTSQVICTYHPSYLLRNPAAKRDVWDDMKLFMAKLGVQL